MRPSRIYPALTGLAISFSLLSSGLIVAAVKSGTPFDTWLIMLAVVAPMAGVLHWLESWVAHDMAYRLLAERGRSGEAYNVCTGTSTSVQEVMDRLLAMAGHEMHLSTDPELFRPADLVELRGDPSRIASDTGWAPNHVLDGTLVDLLEDWRKRLSTAD